MKQCECDPWQTKVKPNLEAPIRFWDSSRTIIPMYYGIEIDCCPFCGERLKESNPTNTIQPQTKDTAKAGNKSK